MKNYFVFDDNKIENFYPITLTQSTSDIVFGTMSIFQRIKRITGKLTLIEHGKYPKNSENNLFVNSRIKDPKSIIKRIEKILEDIVFLDENKDIVCAKTEFMPTSITELKKKKNIKKVILNGSLLFKNLWEIISENEKYLKEDFSDYYDRESFCDPAVGVTLLNPYKIWIGKNSKIFPGVILDANNGPIIIGNSVEIGANSIINGPSFLGDNSVVKALSKIEPATTISSFCKVGGEIERTIFQNFSNKQHDGFLGDSYIGSWVNIGAGVVSSNLKNSYSDIKVYFYPKKKKINSKLMFLGCIIGDYTKIGINCSINTGSVLGCCCNIFGACVISDFVPSFSFGKMGDFQKYQKEKLFQSIKIVKKRRNKRFTPLEKNMLINIYDE